MLSCCTVRSAARPSRRAGKWCALETVPPDRAARQARFATALSGARAGLGPSGAVRKVAEVAALTWAGSQVTKLARAAGAVALAPFVDRLLIAIQGVFHIGTVMC